MEDTNEFFDNVKCHNNEDHVIEDQIDLFFLHHLDTVLDIFYELKEDFKFNPSFLEYLDSTHLTEIFILLIFENTYPTIYIKNYDLLERFINEYCREIENSLKIINLFLKNFNTSMPIHIWTNICFVSSYF